MEQEAHKPKRVLIVEDELIVAADLEISLRDLGFVVLGTVDNAGAAIARVSEDHPDVVLMDIQLHGEPGGLFAAERIREKWNIPVVFLTSYTTDDIMRRARRAGAYGFLSKPFRLDDLGATLNIAIEQHEAGQDIFAERMWLTMILASVSDGVIAVDARGCVRFLNAAAEKMTGWTSAEATTKSIEEVYPLKYMDGTPVQQSQVRRALATRALIPKERFLLQVRGGHELPVEDAAAPILADGHLLGVVTIFLDITAQLKEEDLQREEYTRLQTKVHETEVVLGQTQLELRALTHRLLTAQEDERKRIARDLHDDLGQRAALMAWRVTKVANESRLLPTSMKSQVAALQQEVNDLSTALRRTSHGLHPSIIADLGLEAALRELSETQRQVDIDVAFIARDLPAFISNDVSVALYRVAQEAMRNAVQHAPGAPILIKLAGSESDLQLSIEDAGPGFDSNTVRRSRGLGLLSLQERARSVGGTVAINSVLGKGSTVVVCIPLSRVEDPLAASS